MIVLHVFRDSERDTGGGQAFLLYVNIEPPLIPIDSFSFIASLTE